MAADDPVIEHPNRRKAASKITKVLVVLLLLVSAALIAIVTIGGWDVLQGAKVLQVAYIVLYVLMAFLVARWNRGVLPVAAALAIVHADLRRDRRPAVVRARQGGLRATRRSTRARSAS